MGKIIEELEIAIRGEIEGVYIQKTREITNNIRKPVSAKDDKAGPKSQTGMMGELSTRLKGQSVAGRGVALPGLGWVARRPGD
jgi:hypothetical protein